MEVKLGQKAKDVITGFEGRVTGKAQYLTGCEQALLAPGLKADGDLIGGNWFDEDRLVITDEAMIELPQTANGPDLAPTRSY
jgi:hypothetical protein